MIKISVIFMMIIMLGFQSSCGKRTALDRPPVSEEDKSDDFILDGLLGSGDDKS